MLFYCSFYLYKYNKEGSQMETLSDYKKVLKGLGYGISIKAYSFGRAITYVHLETKEKLTGNVGNSDYFAKWKDLIDYVESNKDAIKLIARNDGLSGWIGW